MKIKFPDNIKIYIACGKTDMRKSIDGLSAIVSQNFKLDPFENALFFFCGGKRDRIKAILWEMNAEHVKKKTDLGCLMHLLQSLCFSIPMPQHQV